MIPEYMEPKGLAPDTKAIADHYRDAEHRYNAERGSTMLRDAIFRARGYAPPKPDPVPVFKKRKPCKRGRPIGNVKVRTMTPRISRIIALAAEQYDVKASEISLPTKRAEFVFARQIAMYLIRKTTSASLPDIGYFLGGRDHTTVLHGIEQVERRIAAVDRKTLEALNAIHAALKA